MRSLLIILLVGATSYHFCDVRSGTTTGAVLMPLLFVFSLIALALWLYVRMRDRSRSGADTSDGVSVLSGFGSGFGGVDD